MPPEIILDPFSGDERERAGARAQAERDELRSCARNVIVVYMIGGGLRAAIDRLRGELDAPLGGYVEEPLGDSPFGA